MWNGSPFFSLLIGSVRYYCTHVSPYSPLFFPPLQVSVAECLARPTRCERTCVRITPQTVVFIATATAICSLGHELRSPLLQCLGQLSLASLWGR